tara:strand:- start:812 stop:1390 length:579 start_codon:yes stop_codon:yes gene_type:complete
MIKFLFLLPLLILYSCSKPKTVLICGDHKCINKKEANQYFEENLSIEVKIINKNITKDYDLVELNLKNNKDKRQVNIYKKEKTNKEVKVLSKNEIDIIKKKIIDKERRKKITKKNTVFKKEVKTKNSFSDDKKIKKDLIVKRNITKNSSSNIDICTILEKCSIDEISKYLIKQGKKRKFPDLTIRQYTTTEN